MVVGVVVSAFLFTPFFVCKQERNQDYQGPYGVFDRVVLLGARPGLKLQHGGNATGWKLEGFP